MHSFKINITVILILIIAGIQSSCTSPQSKLREEIRLAESKLMTDTILSPDAIEAKLLIGLYDKYSKQFPADSLSADYLFKAGEVSTGIMDYQNGINYYARLFEQHTDYSKAPVALFLEGFIFENYIGRLDSAEFYYKKFLELYPDHPISGDVTLSLNNLGKTPEELIEMFQSMEQTSNNSSDNSNIKE